jgi:hypothetical protein
MLLGRVAIILASSFSRYAYSRFVEVREIHSMHTEEYSVATVLLDLLRVVCIRTRTWYGICILSM